MATTIHVPAVEGDSGFTPAYTIVRGDDLPPRQPKNLTKAQVLSYLHWTETEWQAALTLTGDQLKFPAAKILPPSPGSFAFTPIWRDVEIDTWIERLREHIATIQRLVPATKRR